VGVKIDTARLERALNETPRLLTNGMEVAFRRIGLDFRSKMLRQFKPYSPNASRGRRFVMSRSGRLRRSFSPPAITRRSGQLRMRVFIGGGSAPYAAMQEFGDTVRPVTAKNLTIPIADNLRASGTTRFKSLRDLINDPARTVRFMVRPGKSTLVLLRNERKARSKKATVKNVRAKKTTAKKTASVKAPRQPRKDWLLIFVLKKSVTIKPRLGFFRTWNAPTMRSATNSHINDAVSYALRNAWREQGGA